MNKPLFSIITISFNSKSTIKRTIESVLNQTFTDFEYIIIDGLSKDGTIDVIYEYNCLSNGKIRWVSEKDTGIYNAMNKGITMSQGQYIGIVNSDDWLESDALQNVYNAISKTENPEECVYCGWLNFHYQDGLVQVMKTDENRLLREAKRYGIGVRHPATFVPRKIYEIIGAFDENLKIGADTDFILRCFYSSLRFIFIEKELTNMSDGGVSNDFRLYLNGLQDKKYILKKYTHSRSEYIFFLCKWCVRMFIKKIIPLSFIKLYRKNKLTR